MANMTKEQKILRSYNAKNGKIAVKGADGKWGTPQITTYLDSVALEANIGVTPIYGDGELQKEAVNDASKTGNLVFTAPDLEMEVSLGMKKTDKDGALLDIAMRSKTPFCFYHEITNESKTKAVIGKRWIMNATALPASQTYAQNTENPNPNNWTYPITVIGEEAKNSTGQVYVDENGFTQRVYVITKKPDDVGYDTFGDAVPEVVITGVAA